MIIKEQFLIVSGRFSSIKITPAPKDNGYQPSLKMTYHDIVTFEDDLEGVKFENTKEIKYLLQIRGETNKEVMQCRKIVNEKITEGIRFPVELKDEKVYTESGKSTFVKDSILARVTLTASEFIQEHTEAIGTKPMTTQKKA